MADGAGGLRLGLIGLGSMGSALLRGWLRREVDSLPFILPVTVCEADQVRLGAFELAYPGVVAAKPTAAAVAKDSDIIIVAVKPYDVAGVLAGMAPELTPDKTVLSIAAGVRLQDMRAAMGAGAALFRAMPNQAVSVGQGVMSLTGESAVWDERSAGLERLLGLLGYVEVLPESQFNAVTAVAGSAPAFLALVMQGLEDGGVRVGMPRATARRMVRQTVLGTAALMVEEELTGRELADRVTSPGGTTIAGLAVLEDRAVRGAMLRAVEAADERARR